MMAKQKLPYDPWMLAQKTKHRATTSGVFNAGIHPPAGQQQDSRPTTNNGNRFLLLQADDSHLLEATDQPREHLHATSADKGAHKP